MVYNFIQQLPEVLSQNIKQYLQVMIPGYKKVHLTEPHKLAIRLQPIHQAHYNKLLQTVEVEQLLLQPVNAHQIKLLQTARVEYLLQVLKTSAILSLRC